MAENKAKKPEGQEMSLADVQAAIAQMMADAKAQAAKILDDAKAAAAEITAPVAEAKAAAAEKEAEKARGEELVTVKLFRDSGKYKDDVFVAVNGEAIAIKRGEEVQIKRKFAEVLENSDRQDYETAKLIEAEKAKYEKTLKALE